MKLRAALPLAAAWLQLLSPPVKGLVTAPYPLQASPPTMLPLFPLFVSYTPILVNHPHATDLIGRQVAAASIGSAVVPLIVRVGVELVGLAVIPVLLLGFSFLLALLYRGWVALGRKTRDPELDGLRS